MSKDRVLRSKFLEIINCSKKSKRERFQSSLSEPHCVYAINNFIFKNQQRVPINEILLEMMAKEEIITLLPPGGGIHSKQSFIESLLRVKWPENDIDT